MIGCNGRHFPNGIGGSNLGLCMALVDHRESKVPQYEPGQPRKRMTTEWIVMFSTRMRAPVAHMRRWTQRHHAFRDGIDQWKHNALISSLSVAIHAAVFILLVSLVIHLYVLDTILFALVLGRQDAKVITWMVDHLSAGPDLDTVLDSLGSADLKCSLSQISGVVDSARCITRSRVAHLANSIGGGEVDGGEVARLLRSCIFLEEGSSA